MLIVYITYSTVSLGMGLLQQILLTAQQNDTLLTFVTEKEVNFC
jgi:hypothetical protein